MTVRRKVWEIDEQARRKEEPEKWKNHFQTPPGVGAYMLSLLPPDIKTVLEPTPGNGNLVKLLEKRYTVTAPADYFSLKASHYDAVVMNPPFSTRYMFNVPPEFTGSGMKIGYDILLRCMLQSDNIIALMPWFTISDSDIRRRGLFDYGLISVTALPRKTFDYARIQTCVIQLQKGYRGQSIFRKYEQNFQTNLFNNQ